MSAFPDKQMFQNALSRLATLEAQTGGAGSDAPWAYLDHFNRDSSNLAAQGYGLIIDPGNTFVSAKGFESNFSGILRATAFGSSMLITPPKTFGRYGEFEFRFNIHSDLLGSNGFTFEFVNSNNLLFLSLSSRYGGGDDGFITPTFDAWHTWRIIFRPGETRLVRSDGESTTLPAGLVSGPTSALTVNMQLTGGPQDGQTPKVLDLDYIAWRPLPDAPPPEAASGGGGTVT